MSDRKCIKHAQDASKGRQLNIPPSLQRQVDAGIITVTPLYRVKPPLTPPHRYLTPDTQLPPAHCLRTDVNAPQAPPTLTPNPDVSSPTVLRKNRRSEFGQRMRFYAQYYFDRVRANKYIPTIDLRSLTHGHPHEHPHPHPHAHEHRQTTHTYARETTTVSGRPNTNTFVRLSPRTTTHTADTSAASSTTNITTSNSEDKRKIQINLVPLHKLQEQSVVKPEPVED